MLLHVGVDPRRGAGDYAHVGGYRVAGDPHFPIARDSREPCLSCCRKVADVMEEQRASPRGRDSAVDRDRLEIGRGKSVRFAEKKPIEAVRAAVDGDKW